MSALRNRDPKVSGAARGTLITVLVILAIALGAFLWLRGPGPMEFAPDRRARSLSIMRPIPPVFQRR